MPTLISQVEHSEVDRSRSVVSSNRGAAAADTERRPVAPAVDRPALVIVDMQNDFVRVGAPMEVPEARAVIPTTGRLLAGFRAAGLPVVFTRYVACERYRGLQSRLPWIGLLDPPINACTPHHLRRYADRPDSLDCAAVIDELAPRSGEAVVDKEFFSAFHGTNLADRLRLDAVDGLVVAGTLTEMCVEDTARHAVHLGYPTIVVLDAVASTDPAGHAATLTAFSRNYGWTMPAGAVLALIERLPALREAARAPR